MNSNCPLPSLLFSTVYVCTHIIKFSLHGHTTTQHTNSLWLLHITHCSPLAAAHNISLTLALDYGALDGSICTTGHTSRVPILSIGRNTQVPRMPYNTQTHTHTPRTHTHTHTQTHTHTHTRTRTHTHTHTKLGGQATPTQHSSSAAIK